MNLQQRDERRRSTCPTPYDRDSKERQREPIPRALPDVDIMYTIRSPFAICSIPRFTMAFGYFGVIGGGSWGVWGGSWGVLGGFLGGLLGRLWLVFWLDS